MGLCEHYKMMYKKLDYGMLRWIVVFILREETEEPSVMVGAILTKQVGRGMSVSVRYLYACQRSSKACWKEDVDAYECDWMEFGSMFQRRAEWKKKDRVKRVERVVGRRTWCCLRRLRLLSLANGAVFKQIAQKIAIAETAVVLLASVLNVFHSLT